MCTTCLESELKELQSDHPSPVVMYYLLCNKIFSVLDQYKDNKKHIRNKLGLKNEGFYFYSGSTLVNFGPLYKAVHGRGGSKKSKKRSTSSSSHFPAIFFALWAKSWWHLQFVHSFRGSMANLHSQFFQNS